MLQDMFFLKKNNIYSILTQEEYDVVFLFSSLKKKERNSSICLFLNQKKNKNSIKHT
jgi:hypothetical protein